MRKKTKKRILLWVWLLVAVALAGFVLIPPKRPTPVQKWRVPVGITMPGLPPLPSLLPGSGDGLAEALQKPAQEAQAKLNELREEIAEAYEERLAEPPPEPAKPAPPSQEPKASLPPKPTFPDGAVVAIVIDDMGLAPAASQRAARLPAPVTLSYLPYASDLEAQVQAAKAAGHEILLHMPMEPLSSQNPGPNALLAALEPEELIEKINININKFKGYVGVNNHMGSKFTLNREQMGVFSKVIHEKGLFFVDSRTSARSVAEETARAYGVKTASRDVFLDDKVNETAIQNELARLEDMARRNGSAIAIGHPHAATIKALEAWIPDAQKRGLRIVPVGQLVR